MIWLKQLFSSTKCLNIGYFLLFLFSMYPWFVWNNLLFLAFTILMSCYVIYLIIVRNNCISQRYGNSYFIFFFVLLSLWTSIYLKLTGFLSLILTCVLVIALSLLHPKTKSEILRFITKWFSILITISLIAYLSFLIGLLPVSPTTIAFNDGRYESLNYYFFILPLDQEFNTFWRFKAFLMEPGHMMLGTIPLIMANNYNLKNIYVLLLLFAVLFSFSLAGYVTAFLGFILLKANKESVKEFVIGLTIVLLIFIIAYINGMSDFIDNYILNRLNQDVGEAVRRTTPAFDKYVFERVISDPIKNLFGTGLSTAELIDLGGGAGYKPYWSQLGLTGVVLMILSYSSYLMIKPTRKVFAFTLVLLLLLAQDSYPTWFCLLIPYILGMGRITYNR